MRRAAAGIALLARACADVIMALADSNSDMAGLARIFSKSIVRITLAPLLEAPIKPARGSSTW